MPPACFLNVSTSAPTNGNRKPVAPFVRGDVGIAPGVIKTDMLDALPPEVLPQLAEETPLRRLGTPEDIAHAAAFLASEKADFITGQVLTVDGGFIL